MESPFVSLVILEYIDETFEGPSILPKDPYDRAIAHFWAKFLDDTCHIDEVILQCIPLLGKVLFGKGEEAEKSKEEFGGLLKILDNEFKDKKFFVGDTFGFADVAANFMAFWFGILEEASGVVLVTSEKFPNFCGWRDEYINRSQVKEYLPSRDGKNNQSCDMEKIKLLGVSLSPFTHRVEWALKIKGVEYELIVEDPQNKSPLLLESNPIHKKIPVLIHNGKPISESMVIVEYIDETFEGPSILPKDPYDRAIARFWAKFLDDKCLPAMGKALLGNEEEKEKAKEECSELLKILDNELKNKEFFVGDKIGFVDIAANVLAFWMGIIEEASGVILVTNKKFPNYYAWRDNYINCSQTKV
ncbi:hypothetical protein H5410_044227 [Solanum commersonii]|uniref:Probable glutathione S-transferase n=1 Tax=Solanum commersonii TaxID=4109 RepID=A0A9J5X679_SOLCO|nr:hypothetical protein H5410_044227 [Solanum commersonii]